MAIPSSGPFLTAALFCEDVSYDDDGAITMHRLVDALEYQFPNHAAPDFPTPDSPLVGQRIFYLCFKTDSQEDRYHVKITCEHPDRTESVVFNAPLEVQPMHNGCSLALELVMEFDHPGKRWYRVELDGQMVARVPLLVFFERKTAEQGMKPPRFTLRFLLVAVPLAVIGLWGWKMNYSPRPISDLDAQVIEVGYSEWQVRYLLGAPHHVYRGKRVTWGQDLAGTLEYENFEIENGKVKIERMSYISGPPDEA